MSINKYLIIKYFCIFAKNFMIMKEISEILKSGSISEIVSSLKERSIVVPEWGELLKQYEPKLHDIIDDVVGRPDKPKGGGKMDAAARLSIGLEKLLTKRITEFTFAIPVKRIYTNTDTDAKKQIANAIEKIYTHAHINSENIKRGIAYYASCEILTIWYTKKSPTKVYGFNSEFKLKCKTFSPMDGVKLYPLFDEKDDMIAMSFEYKKTVKEKEVIFFETFTEDRHYIWMQKDGSSWDPVIDGEEISIKKIPAIYLWRPQPCWDGLCDIRENIEYTLSRNSDVVAYNSAPILKVAGGIEGTEQKGETRRVYRVQDGGDVAYVSWQQSIDALKYHVDTLIKLYFMQSQMPDISFENMKTLGNIGYDSRKTLLSDAHLKIGEESGPWLEFFEREDKIIRAFLKEMSKETGWTEDDIDSVGIEHVITPFIQEDEKTEIDKWQTASGGKALISHRDAIKNAGLTDDPEKTYNEILGEEKADAENRSIGMNNMFSAE